MTKAWGQRVQVMALQVPDELQDVPLVQPLATRNEKGYFLPGFAHNPSGRPKMRVGTSLGELRRACREALPDLIKDLHELRKDPDSKVRMRAVEVMLERGFGKAVQPVEVGGAGAFDGMTDLELEAFCRTEAVALLGAPDDEQSLGDTEGT